MVNTPNGGLTKYAESAKSLIAYVAVQHGANYRVNPNARKLFLLHCNKKIVTRAKFEVLSGFELESADAKAL
jgi:hypothetical protein